MIGQTVFADLIIQNVLMAQRFRWRQRFFYKRKKGWCKNNDKNYAC